MGVIGADTSFYSSLRLLPKESLSEENSSSIFLPVGISLKKSEVIVNGDFGEGAERVFYIVIGKFLVVSALFTLFISSFTSWVKPSGLSGTPMLGRVFVGVIISIASARGDVSNSDLNLFFTLKRNRLTAFLSPPLLIFTALFFSAILFRAVTRSFSVAC